MTRKFEKKNQFYKLISGNLPNRKFY